MTARRETLLKADWHTAAELAKLSLHGLPKTKRRINTLIEREGWAPRGQKLARRRNGRGGGMEYHINNLPAPSRHHLALERHKHLMPEGVEIMTPETEPEDFTQSQSIRRDARLEILAIFTVFHKNCDLAQRTSEFQFARAWNAGAVQAPGWVLAEIKTVSAPSIQRWRKARDNGQLHDLGGKYKHGKKSVLARANDGEVALFITVLISEQPHLTAHHIRQITRDKYNDEAILDGGEIRSMPPIRAFQRFIAGWKKRHEMVLTHITNPDKFRGTMRLCGTNQNKHVRRVNQLWEMDASPADVLCKDGRHNIYMIIDIFSRRALVMATRTANTDDMLLLFRRAVLEWGVPEEIRIDNGSDYISYRAKRAYNSLGILTQINDAYSPQQKGTVERAIGTLQRGLMPLLPGFIGHNVAQRKALESRKSFAQRLAEIDASDEDRFEADLTMDELQVYADRWVETYNNRVHSKLEMSPVAKAASCTNPVRRIENADALDMLLMPIIGKKGTRKVQNGTIRYDSTIFISGDLIHGEKVFIRHDPKDMGRIYCFENEDGPRIAVAEAPERLGKCPKEFVKFERAKQMEKIKAQSDPLKAGGRKIGKRDLIEAYLRQEDRDTGNITAFPARSEEHSTPALSAVEEALKPNIEPEMPLTSEEIEAAARARAALDDNNVIPLHAAGPSTSGEPDMSDDLTFYAFAQRHPERLNDIQKGYLAELRDCPTFQQRLQVQAAKG